MEKTRELDPGLRRGSMESGVSARLSPKFCAAEKPVPPTRAIFLCSSGPLPPRDRCDSSRDRVPAKAGTQSHMRRPSFRLAPTPRPRGGTEGFHDRQTTFADVLPVPGHERVLWQAKHVCGAPAPTVAPSQLEQRPAPAITAAHPATHRNKTARSDNPMLQAAGFIAGGPTSATTLPAPKSRRTPSVETARSIAATQAASATPPIRSCRRRRARPATGCSIRCVRRSGCRRNRSAACDRRRCRTAASRSAGRR